MAWGLSEVWMLSHSARVCVSAQSRNKDPVVHVCVCVCACACACRGAGRSRPNWCFLLRLSSSPLSQQESITVYFHAIISKDFSFDPNHHHVFVKGGEEFGKPKWNLNVCEMHCTK